MSNTRNKINIRKIRGLQVLSFYCKCTYCDRAIPLGRKCCRGHQRLGKNNYMYGRKPHNFGVPCSAEMKENLRLKNTGKKLSQETIAKMRSAGRAARTGPRWSNNDTVCTDCGEKEYNFNIYIATDGLVSKHPTWRTIGDSGFLCSRCYSKRRYDPAIRHSNYINNKERETKRNKEYHKLHYDPGKRHDYYLRVRSNKFFTPEFRAKHALRERIRKLRKRIYDTFSPQRVSKRLNNK